MSFIFLHLSVKTCVFCWWDGEHWYIKVWLFRLWLSHLLHAVTSTFVAEGRFKNTYELLNLRALKFSHVNKIHIFQYMGKIFCVEFQRYRLKFHTIYLTHCIHWKKRLLYNIEVLRALESLNVFLHSHPLPHPPPPHPTPHTPHPHAHAHPYPTTPHPPGLI